MTIVSGDGGRLTKPQFSRSSGTCTALLAVITDLLLLSGCQAGVGLAVRTPVCLRGASEVAWSNHADEAASRGLRLRLDASIALSAPSDEGKLGILLANAVAYPAANTENHFVARQVEGAFPLDVARSAEDHAGLEWPSWWLSLACSIMV